MHAIGVPVKEMFGYEASGMSVGEGYLRVCHMFTHCFLKCHGEHKDVEYEAGKMKSRGGNTVKVIKTKKLC